jgi:hypothetical protein
MRYCKLGIDNGIYSVLKNHFFPCDCREKDVCVLKYSTQFSKVVVSK